MPDPNKITSSSSSSSSATYAASSSYNGSGIIAVDVDPRDYPQQPAWIHDVNTSDAASSSTVFFSPPRAVAAVAHGGAVAQVPSVDPAAVERAIKKVEAWVLARRDTLESSLSQAGVQDGLQHPQGILEEDEDEAHAAYRDADAAELARQSSHAHTASGGASAQPSLPDLRQVFPERNQLRSKVSNIFHRVTHTKSAPDLRALESALAPSLRHFRELAQEFHRHTEDGFGALQNLDRRRERGVDDVEAVRSNLRRSMDLAMPLYNQMDESTNTAFRFLREALLSHRGATELTSHDDRLIEAAMRGWMTTFVDAKARWSELRSGRERHHVTQMQGVEDLQHAALIAARGQAPALNPVPRVMLRRTQNIDAQPAQPAQPQTGDADRDIIHIRL